MAVFIAILAALVAAAAVVDNVGCVFAIIVAAVFAVVVCALFSFVLFVVDFAAVDDEVEDVAAALVRWSWQ